jgi:hypothetical protein
MEPVCGLRCTRRMRRAPIITVVTALALGVPVSAPASTSWAALHRPLLLEPLKPGARCPVTPSHRLDHGRILAVGNGPIYALTSRFGPDGRHARWLGAKTLWVWPARLRKHGVDVLIRGRRLDRAGTMRFQLGPDWGSPLTSELRIDTTRSVGTFSEPTWGTTVTMLFGRAPGCYGLQLDTAAGTSTIVVAA